MRFVGAEQLIVKFIAKKQVVTKHQSGLMTVQKPFILTDDKGLRDAFRLGLNS